MSIGNLIKNIIKGFFYAVGIWMVLAFILIALTKDNGTDIDAISAIMTICIVLIVYPSCVYYLYNKDKKQSTCPRCKTPFVYYEEQTGSETLSEDYISQDVKDSDGIYRRKSYKVGKARYYYEAKCKECGFTKERSEVSNFKREI